MSVRKVVNLFRFQTIYSISIHSEPSLLGRHDGHRYRYWKYNESSPSVLGNKHLITRLHHSGIIHIHVLYKEPGTYAIISQLAALFHQLHHIVIQQQTGLVFRIGGTIERAAPQR